MRLWRIAVPARSPPDLPVSLFYGRSGGGAGWHRLEMRSPAHFQQPPTTYIPCIAAGVPSDQVETPTISTDSGGSVAASAAWSGEKNQ